MKNSLQWLLKHPRKPCPDDSSCAGVLLHAEKGTLERCDICRRFKTDKDAALYVHILLTRLGDL